jgi:hypothetical protein
VPAENSVRIEIKRDWVLDSNVASEHEKIHTFLCQMDNLEIKSLLIIILKSRAGEAYGAPSPVVGAGELRDHSVGLQSHRPQ